MKSLVILGRQPKLGLAELESLYKPEHIVALGEDAAVSDLTVADIAFSRLGGSVKLCEIHETIETTDWKRIEKALIKVAPGLFTEANEGKLHLGLSVYGQKMSPLDIHATALRLKKIVRAKTNQTVRVVPNTATLLSSAQIIHNKLLGSQGAEIVVYITETQTIIAKTVAEQDIDAYTKRDQARPKRDARVGMLPPKLAQIIINLATSDTDPKHGSIVLDPFCGTGVVLQEASLMGFDIAGSDLEPRMVEYTDANLQWLATINLNIAVHSDDGTYYQLKQADATTDELPKANIIACEGYLGQPFSAFPAEDKLREVMQTCNGVMKGFLKNIHGQIEPETRLCIGLPAWVRPNGTIEHLKLLDSLEELGYNRVSFVHVRTQELLYYRPGQVVARELLVITRK
jgi:tRNA G10  N-methylase Trm11